MPAKRPCVTWGRCVCVFECVSVTRSGLCVGIPHTPSGNKYSMNSMIIISLVLDGRKLLVLPKDNNDDDDDTTQCDAKRI